MPPPPPPLIHPVPDAQLTWVRAMMTDAVRARLDAQDIHEFACRQNGEPGYGRVEADMLYSLVRTGQPRRIVQIGCGVSTAVMLAAAADAGYRPTLLAVDPFPTDYLRRPAASGVMRPGVKSGMPGMRGEFFASIVRTSGSMNSTCSRSNGSSSTNAIASVEIPSSPDI